MQLVRLELILEHFMQVLNFKNFFTRRDDTLSLGAIHQTLAWQFLSNPGLSFHSSSCIVGINLYNAVQK